MLVIIFCQKTLAAEVSKNEIKSIFSKLTPSQISQVARHPLRPYTYDYIKHLEIGMNIEFIANVIRPSFSYKETIEHCKVVGKIVFITNGIMKAFGTREDLLKQKVIVDVTDLNTVHEAEVKLANAIEKLNNKKHD